MTSLNEYKDAKKIAKEIAAYSLSPDELSQLKDDEVWIFEKHIKEMIEKFRKAFSRLDPALSSIVYQVFDSIVEESMVRRARNDSNAFVEYIFVDDVSGDPLQQEEAHIRWQNTMNNHKRCLIIAPREHGKTTQVLGFVLWKLGRDPNLRIKIVSNNDKMAQKRILALQLHIESNKKLHRVFPHLKPDSRAKWNNQSFYVKRSQIAIDPSVEGYGVLSGGTGGRCDLMVLDDIVDRKNALTHPGLRKAVKDAVKTDWLALFSGKVGVISICTLWHKDDLNCELGGQVLRDWIRYQDGKIDEPPNQSNIQKGDWYVSFDAVGEDFEPVCPRRWPKERLEEKRREVGRSAFNKGWRNRVIDDDETVIDPSWIFYFNKGSRPSRKDLFLLQSYDLAISQAKGKRSYFTCCTMGAHFLPDVVTIYILDSFRKRLSFPAQVRIVKAGYHRIKPDVIVLEANAYQAALYQQLLDTTLLPVVPMISKMHKKFRLDSTTPAMEGGHVLFNPRMNPDINPSLEKRGDLIGELLDFPFGESDDQVDAYSQGVRYIQEYAPSLQLYESQMGGEANVYALDALGELEEIGPSTPVING